MSKEHRANEKSSEKQVRFDSIQRTKYDSLDSCKFRGLRKQCICHLSVCPSTGKKSTRRIVVLISCGALETLYHRLQNCNANIFIFRQVRSKICTNIKRKRRRVTKKKHQIKSQVILTILVDQQLLSFNKDKSALCLCVLESYSLLFTCECSRQANI